jgi:hypothetical protein
MSLKMTMIVCTNCGKHYPGNEVSCPDCGNPTADIATNFGLAKYTKGTGARAKEIILAQVAKVKLAADKANKLFDQRNAAIQSQIRMNINLFSENAASKTVGIIAKATYACDDLYASLQALVVEVDSVCRPYLADDPGADAIKAVAELIASLNEDSEIENNGTITINGAYAGNASASKYMPGLQARMIQKFWEGQYSMTPEGIEAEIKRREAAEKVKQRRLAEQKKQEELDAAAKKHMDEVVTVCHSKVSSFQNALDKELSDRRKQITEEVAVYRNQLVAEKAGLEKELSNLGTFHIRERRQKKEAIRELNIRLTKLSDRSLLAAEEDRLKQRAEDAIRQYDKSVKQYLNLRFPNRASPPKSRHSIFSASDAMFENTKYALTPYPEPPDPHKVFDE